MGRHIFLIRHGRLILPGNGHYCIGNRSDVPLSDAGIAQAERMRSCFRNFSVIYCSGMKRSLQFGQIIAGNHADVTIVEGLDEMDVGEWEGKAFSEIRCLYRKTYMDRGMDWSIPTDGGETLQSVADRSQQALIRLLQETQGNLAIVTHDSVIRALLWRLQHLNTQTTIMPRMAMGSITVLCYEYGAFSVKAVGCLPEDTPSEDEIYEIWDECGLPDEIRNHSMAVYEKCDELFELLKEKNVCLSQNMFFSASLLHDVSRSLGPNHHLYASELVRERGYLNLANIIEDHAMGSKGQEINEAQILFLVDKMIMGSEFVGLEKYFKILENKAVTIEQLALNQKKKANALRIRKTIEEILGMEI